MSDKTQSRILSGSFFAGRGISLHSLLVERDGELLIEAYAPPWGRDSLHRMYSVTKSVVSLAVGKLLEDGKLRLSDHITSYFPELLPDPVPPELEALTIEHMLTMRTCHSLTTYKQGADARYIPSWHDRWLWSFFNTKPDHQPGMVFKYDTSSTHLLASLVERLSGQDFVSFVSSRVSPLDGRTYITKDPEGNPCGGSGLMMTSRGLLSLARTVLRSDSPYVKKAVSRIVENAVVHSGPDQDLEAGYGYQFWRLSHNAFCMYGMGGQFAVIVPDTATVAVTTANTLGAKNGERTLLEGLWALLDALDGPVDYSIKPLIAEGRPLARTDVVSCVFPENRTLISAVTFDFRSRRLIITADGRCYSLAFGYGERGRSPFGVECIDWALTSAAELPDGTISFLSELIGQEIGMIKLKAAFSGDLVTLHAECFGEVRFRGFNGIVTGKVCQS